ncbi:MAG: metallophosphoesterase [Pseudomonadota bacterium]
MYRRRDIAPEGGVFVIADLHGDFDALDAALSAAPAGAFIVFLGDIVDRGGYSPFCAERMLEILGADRGVLVPGNHDVALVEVVEGRRGATPRRVETLAQFEAYGGDLLTRFCDAVRAAPLCLRIGAFAFAHAAWRAEMETDGAWSAPLRRLALQGEFRATPERRRPERVRRWVDSIPRGRTIMVGHEARSETGPLVVHSRLGGTAAFLDLGCGDGGRLGCARIQGEDVAYLSVAGACR